MNAMLVVTDMDKTVAFYRRVLGLEVVMDFGANKTLTGGLALQTLETYRGFIDTDDISFGGNDFELYFEADDFDTFADNLRACDVQYVHPVKEHSWGQRVVRFYDPDRHIIEVGENMKAVCKRFIDRGMTLEQTAERMDVPVEYVKGMVAEEDAAAMQLRETDHSRPAMADLP
jgi:Lactoylglutathione lyase and related lyases